MEAFLPEFYYSPKTYGLEGLNFKGFEVDQIFSAGSNIARPEDIPHNTFGILKYHIKRSLLLAILAIIGYFDEDAVYKSDSSLLDVVSQLIALFNNIVTWWAGLTPVLASIVALVQGVVTYTEGIVTWIQGILNNIISKIPFIGSKIVTVFHYASEFGTVALKKIIPYKRNLDSGINFLVGPIVSEKNIALVIHSNDFVAPPPPIMPTPEEQATMEPTEIELLNAQLQFYNDTEAFFRKEEAKRVIDEAAAMIHWSFVLNLRNVTLCEYWGYISKDSDALIDAIKTRFEKAHERMPQMSIIVPSKELVFEISSNSNHVNSVIAASTSTSNKNNSNSNTSRTPSISRPNSYGSNGLLSGGIRTMKIVVLDRKNGKRLTMKGLRSTCALVKKGSVDPGNVVETVESYMERHGITSFDLVVSSGPSIDYNGLPPLSVRDSATFHHTDMKTKSLSTNILSEAIKFYIKEISREISEETE